MNIPARFLLQQFQLEVKDAAYIVEVSVHKGNTNGFNDLNNLPEWVFQSKHAIWLSQKDGSLIDRAIEGEQIREKLCKDSALFSTNSTEETIRRREQK